MDHPRHPCRRQKRYSVTDSSPEASPQAAPDAESKPPARKRSKWNPLAWMRSVYDWMMRYADKPNAERALFGISFAEASFFPIPPDPLLMVMGAAHPKKAIRFATVTTVASVLGAMLGWAIGMFLWDVVGEPLVHFYDGEEVMVKIRDMFDEYGLFALLIAAITPIPFKVFTIATGMMVSTGADIGFAAFVGACFVGRGFRFYLEGILLRFFGTPIVAWMEKWFDLLAILFTVLLIGGFAMIKFIG
jgi:membrane protein YqaA with SNARE-associated domain